MTTYVVRVGYSEILPLVEIPYPQVQQLQDSTVLNPIPSLHQSSSNAAPFLPGRPSRHDQHADIRHPQSAESRPFPETTLSMTIPAAALAVAYLSCGLLGVGGTICKVVTVAWIIFPTVCKGDRVSSGSSIHERE